LGVRIGIGLFAVALFFGWRLWDARNQIQPARILLNATATNVTFLSTAEDTGRILRAIDSSSVYVRNFARANLGPGSLQPPSKLSDVSSDLVLETADPGSAINVSDAALTGIDFPTGTSEAQVSLLWDDSASNALALSVSPVESVRLSARHKRKIQCDYCSLENAGRPSAMDSPDFWFVSQDPLGHEMKIVPREGVLNLSVTLASPGELRIREIVVPSSLKFQKMEGPRTISSILSGEVRFPDLDDKKLELPAASPFTLDGLKGFEIREIRIDKGLSLTATGTVGAMTIARANALPSNLQVWTKTHPLDFYGSMRMTAAGALTAIGAFATALLAHFQQKKQLANDRQKK